MAGSDDLQLKLRKRVLERGERYITTTSFRGRRWLRLTLMNPETEFEDIRGLVEELKIYRSTLAGENSNHLPRRLDNPHESERSSTNPISEG